MLPKGFTEQRIRAAVLCSLDDETDEEIARRLGVCRRTLARWKKRPEFVFAARVIGEYTVEQSVRAMVGRYRARVGTYEAAAERIG